MGFVPILALVCLVAVGGVNMVASFQRAVYLRKNDKPSGVAELRGAVSLLIAIVATIIASIGWAGMDAHYDALAREWIMQITVRDDGTASIPTYRQLGATAFYYDACNRALTRAGWTAENPDALTSLSLHRAAPSEEENDATLIERKRLKLLFQPTSSGEFR